MSGEPYLTRCLDAVTRVADGLEVAAVIHQGFIASVRSLVIDDIGQLGAAWVRCRLTAEGMLEPEAIPEP